MGVKRSSPEPIDNGINRGQMQKKPKVQKKKKKRDPNEPQKYLYNVKLVIFSLFLSPKYWYM